LKFGIFLSDASFDHKTRVSVIGITETISGKTYQFLYENPKNPTDAEKFGVQKAIEIALNEKFDNVVFICDNKSAINMTRKKFFSKEELRSLFWYTQFVWLPREFMGSADFLSKHVDKELEAKILQSKEKNTADKYESFEAKHRTKHINAINVDKTNVHESIIQKRIQQFIALKEGEFKSKLFSEIETLSTSDMSTLIFDEIELIETDIKEIEDPFLKAIGQTLLDMLISF